MAAGARPRPRAANAGFTLAELCIVIVLMGLVLAPLSIAVTQALTFLPESKQRSDQGLHAALLIDRFAADVTQANGALEIVDIPVACGATTSLDAGEPGIWYRSKYREAHGSPADSVTYRDGALVSYVARWDAVAGGDGATRRLTLERRVDSVDGGRSTETLLSGYCHSGSDPDVVVSASDGEDAALGAARLRISLRPTPDAGLTEIDVGGTIRYTTTTITP